MIHFGTAGWLYKDWEGIVYPSPKPDGFDPLGYLARYFNTVEINSTYYGPATAKTANNWVARVADYSDFQFTAKLWKRFTHERKTAWTRTEVKEARSGFVPLMKAGKLGAVLMQFPWSFRRTDENREWLDDVTRTFREFPLVLEVRHSSWNTPEFYDELSERGIGFVNIDQPLFHNSIKPSATVTGAVGYVRVHGRNYKDWFRRGAGVEARYDYLYTKQELEPWAQRAREIASAAQETFVVTNNHYKGKAAVNALMLKNLVTGRKTEAPPDLVETYPEELEPAVKKVRRSSKTQRPA
jgi:uncharacterized protein YecE (DUF72 family)